MKNEFIVDIIFNKLRYKLFIVLFIILRFLDYITTIAGINAGFIEHYNPIYILTKSHEITNLITSLGFLIFFIFLYYFHDKCKNSKTEGNKVYIHLISFIFIVVLIGFHIPVINNLLILIGIYPPENIQFHKIFFILLIIFMFSYLAYMYYKIRANL